MEEMFKPIVTPLQSKVESSKLKEENIKKEEKPQVEKEEVQEQEIEKSVYTDPEQYNILISNDESSLNNTSFAITQPPSTSTPARKNPLLANYLQRLSKKHKDNDMRYGVRRKRGELHMGDSPISFANDTISVKGKNYPITSGLLELLFRKSPDDALITLDDKDNYLDIIEHTNTHRKSYDPNRTIYEDITIKYNKYVADFLTKFGKGLPKYMIVFIVISRKQRLPMDYVYWDDPNELVDRLRLLMTSQAAGNPSHTNEIIIDIFGRPLHNDKSVQRGPAGRGFNVTSDGNYNIENKRLCNLGNPSNEHDAATYFHLTKIISNISLRNSMIDKKAVIAEELHKPARRNYKRRHVDIRGLDETWQADLVEMIPYASVNKGYKYLLTIIDIFSKYAWAVPIKSKSGVDITSAMKSVLQQGRIPKNLHVDQVKSFTTKNSKI
ncbi:GSCOCG00006156001-RA-CDS [Cotesia congregata]|nr:GSCOCG00006156001-RA-CDS [Cotesia congregata]